MDAVLKNPRDKRVLQNARKEVRQLTKNFPLSQA
jgi:glycine/serine hydroxymethyltransferase